MIDESFRLTPLDVRRYEFGTAMRGYDKARVDQFRERVADELEELTRKHQDLDSRVKGLQEQLRAYRERDKALNDALVSAQQLRAEMREQAEKEAQLIMREAKGEGERMIEEARAEVRRLAGELEGLERARRAYLMQLRTLVERQLADLDAMAAGPAALPPGALNGEDGAARPSSPTPAWLNAVARGK